MRRSIFAAFASLAAMSCGPSDPHAKSATALPPHEGVLHYYPLDQGTQWMYTVRDRALEGGMLASTKVVSFRDGVAVLQTGNDRQQLRVMPDGIVRDPAGGYLLKWPIRVGDRWPSAEGGSVTVSKVDVAISVEAGAYTECATTSEAFPDGSTIERTFCPEVGPVVITARAVSPTSVVETTAQLRAFGMPRNLAYR